MGVIILDPGKSTLKGLKFSNSFELEDVLKLTSKTERKHSFIGFEDSSRSGRYQIDIPDTGKFIIGDGVESYNAEHTKVNVHSKVCILTGIAALSAQDEAVDVIVGFPSSDYANKKLVSDLKALIPLGKSTLILNDEVKVINIKSINVYAEGMMFKARNRCSLNYPNAEIINCIDVGGYNTNMRQYDKVGNLLKHVSLNNAGINSLEVFLKDELAKNIDTTLYSVDDVNICKCIREGTIPNIHLNPDTYATAEEFLKLNITNYIETSILSKLMIRGIDLKSKGHLNAISGGGSHIIKKYMSDTLAYNFDNIIFTEDPQYENCISYTCRYLLSLAKDGTITLEYATAKVKEFLGYTFEDAVTVGMQKAHFSLFDNLNPIKQSPPLQNKLEIKSNETTLVAETTHPEPQVVKNNFGVKAANVVEVTKEPDNPEQSE